MCAFAQMRSASDQLTTPAEFDQMRNVWPNVRAFGQLRCTFGQIYKKNGQLRCAFGQMY